MPEKNPEQLSSDNPDMRYFPRWEVNDRVLYRVDGENESYEGQTKDISCAGACIIGGWNIEPDQKIEISIHLSNDTTVKAFARILWAKIKDGQPQMGVIFDSTSDQFKDSILQHAFELDRKKFVKHWFKGWSDS